MFTATVRPVGGLLFPMPGAGPVTIPRLHKKPVEKIIRDRNPQLLFPNPEENGALHCFASSLEACGRVFKWCWGTLPLLNRGWTLGTWPHTCYFTPRCSPSHELTVHHLFQLSEQEGLKRSLVMPGIWLLQFNLCHVGLLQACWLFAHLKPSCAGISAYAFLRENGCRYLYSLISAPKQSHRLVLWLQKASSLPLFFLLKLLMALGFRFWSYFADSEHSRSERMSSSDLFQRAAS